MISLQMKIVIAQPRVTDLSCRAVTYADKILNGAKPADLPVEQPTKLEFLLALKAVKQAALPLPPDAQARGPGHPMTGNGRSPLVDLLLASLVIS